MSLINTRIQNVRAKGNLDKNELRPSRYGAIDLFITETDNPVGIITPELKEKAIGSIGSTLETPVIDFDGAVTIGNARSLTIADSENTSQMRSISFATFAWGFTQTPAMFTNNEIGAQRDFEVKFLKYLYKLAETLDSAAVAALAAAKTQVFGDTLAYDVVGNVLQVPWKMRENIVGDINPMMAANDYFGDMHVLGNGGLESLVRKMAESSIYNAENKTLQYADKILHFTPRIANGAGEYGNFFAIEGGSLGLLARFEREALLGTVSRTGHEWGIETLPLLNIPVGTYFYESVGDFKGIAGAATADMDRARKQHFGFAVDIALITSYNSAPATRANPVMKATIYQENES